VKHPGVLVLTVCLAAVAMSGRGLTRVEPLIEFTSSPAVAGGGDSLPTIQACAYYVLVRGRLGHSGGFRLGAAVGLKGDTIAVRVEPYRVSEFTPRDWQDERWTVRIGNLEARSYTVTVRAAKTILTNRVALNPRDGGCNE